MTYFITKVMSQSEQEGNFQLVDSRMIALISSKRKFDPEKEAKYIEKARTTKCRCHHYTQTRPCFYRTCRHMPENHYGLYYSRVQDGTKINESWRQENDRRAL